MLDIIEIIRKSLPIDIQIESEHISTRNSLNRILSENCISNIDIPRFNRVAMDGYAINGVGLYRYELLDGCVLAGDSSNEICNSIPYGKAIRIMTGARAPYRTESILRWENVKEDKEKNFIYIDDNKTKYGMNIAWQGEDIKRGEIAIERLSILNPISIANLLSIGYEKIHVFKKIRIGILTTGNEISSSFNTMLDCDSHIMNSNAVLLENLCKERKYIEISEIRHVSDELLETREAILRLSENSDILVTTGGASKGDSDYVSRILQDESIFNKVFYEINMKPGRHTHMCIRKDNRCIVYGLPGNPVSVYVLFYVLILSTIQILLNKNWKTDLQKANRSMIDSTIIDSIKNDPDRRIRFVPVYIGHDCIQYIRYNGSGDLISMLNSNGFLIVDPNNIDIDSDIWIMKTT